jgi:hypothetical protein
MVLESTEIHGSRKKNIGRVLKELCHGKAETLGDAGEAARGWRYNVV